MRQPPDRPRYGPYEAGRRAGRADRHFLGRGDYQGWDGPGEWTAWYRGWLEGQREAREDGARTGARMRYEPFFRALKKSVVSDCLPVHARKVGVR